MTRHSKNNTDGAVFTYHERRKMNHGSKYMRIPTVAIKRWNQCSLSLSVASGPVLTPDGILYDREAIILNLLHQKETARKNLAIENLNQERIARNAAKRKAEEKLERNKIFVETQETIHEHGEGKRKERSGEKEGSGGEEGRTNFWLPSDNARRAASDTRPTKRRKKDSASLRTVCPITQKPLKSRDLITLNLMPVKQNSIQGENEKDLLESSESQVEVMYMCPICQTTLVNSVKPVALRTGTVLCSSCVTEFVLKNGRDPVTDVVIDLQTDVIKVQNCGTGFAGSAPDDCKSKEAKLYRPSAR